MRDRIRRDFDRANRNMVIVFLAISVPFLLGAGYMSYRSLWFKFGAEQAQGRIVEIQGPTPKLLVEFRTDRAQLRRINSAGSDLYKNYMVGDMVTVCYDAEEPATARLDLFVEMWLFPVLLGVFGGFFFLPVVLMGGFTEAKQWMNRGNLERDGMVVQADYQGYELMIDPDVMSLHPGQIQSLSLRNENGKYRLMHNGRERDPLDPVVQRELSLRFVVKAQWQNPKTGQQYVFESDPVAENPERYVRNGRVPVRVDPNDPETYRFEPPLGTGGSGKKNSFIE